MSALSEAGIAIHDQHYSSAVYIIKPTIRQHLRIRVGLVIGRSVLGKGITAYEKIRCDHIV